MADHYEQIGLEFYRQGDKIWGRVLLFGLLLILSHSLQIAPSEIDAAGAKIAIKDPIVIQGSLAILYIHYFWMVVSNMTMTSGFIPLKSGNRMTRSFLRAAYRPYRSPQTKKLTQRKPRQAKRRVWWQMFTFNLFMLPYFLVVALLLIAALALALSDALVFGTYIWRQPWNLGPLGDLF